jgi:hypothetical protein
MGRKKTKQMPKARRDKMSYERHNRIVHLLKTECSFPAASQTACMPPYSRSQVSHLRVRRMLTDMPTVDFHAGKLILSTSAKRVTA